MGVYQTFSNLLDGKPSRYLAVSFAYVNFVQYFGTNLQLIKNYTQCIATMSIHPKKVCIKKIRVHLTKKFYSSFYSNIGFMYCKLNIVYSFALEYQVISHQH